MVREGEREDPLNIVLLGVEVVVEARVRLGVARGDALHVLRVAQAVPAPDDMILHHIIYNTI